MCLVLPTRSRNDCHPLFLISQQKITTRCHIYAKEKHEMTIHDENLSISVYIKFFFIFLSLLRGMVRGIFRFFLIFSIGRRISRWHAISTFVSGIIMRRPRSLHVELVSGEVWERSPFRFESASIKTPRMGRTNCRIYGSLIGRTWWICWIHPVIVKISVASEKKRNKSETKKRQRNKKNVFSYI